MTQDQIEHLAREYGDTVTDARGRESFEFDYHGLARLVAAVEAAERERCAILCETTASQHYASARIAADYLPVQFRAAAEALTNAAAAIRGG